MIDHRSWGDFAGHGKSAGTGRMRKAAPSPMLAVRSFAMTPPNSCPNWKSHVSRRGRSINHRIAADHAVGGGHENSRV